MFTRTQREDMTTLVKEAVSMLVLDEKFITTLAGKVSESLKPLFEQQSKIIENLQTKVDEVTKENQDLSRRVKFLEKSLIKNTIRIVGMGDESPDQNIEGMVNNLFNNVLKLNIPTNSVADVYRINYKKKEKNEGQKVEADKVKNKATVIVRFASFKERQLVLKSRKHLKSTGITIYEELSRDTIMLYEKAVKKYSRRNVWTFGDRVFGNINGVKKRLYEKDVV